MPHPTPEQAREVAAHFGNQRKAAKACGVAYSTFQLWLRPHQREKARAQRRAYWRKQSAEQRKAHSARWAANAKKRTDAGLCRSCGAPRVTSEFCRHCQDRSNARTKPEHRQRWVRKKIDQGLCTECGKEPLLTERLCWDCRDRKRDKDFVRYWGVDPSDEPDEGQKLYLQGGQNGLA